ncbi:hypothetical protein PSEUDO8O_120507 [Pseudomonas sp. 8O]|nr:hypothetical protein PSEUDO8O_120507 [Pseudomonas sp. 8O]
MHGLASRIAALNALEVAMKEGAPREPVPANTAIILPGHYKPGVSRSLASRLRALVCRS